MEVNATSNNTQIILYVAIINGELNSTSETNELIVSNLEADTDYDIIVTAIDSIGNSKKSTIHIKTKKELLFTKEILDTGSKIGSVSVTQNNLDGTAGLSITGRANCSVGNIVFNNLLRWYKEIDLTEYNTLKFYAKKGANHGILNVIIDNTSKKELYYNSFSTSWTEYTIDLSEYSGNHTINFIGGYTDTTGSTSSNTQYCNIILTNE